MDIYLWIMKSQVSFHRRLRTSSADKGVVPYDKTENLRNTAITDSSQPRSTRLAIALTQAPQYSLKCNDNLNNLTE